MVVCFLLCRSHAIACVNQFIVTRTQALMVHIGTFIEVGILFCFFGIQNSLKSAHGNSLKASDYTSFFVSIDSLSCF